MIIPGLVSATFKTESPDFVLAALKKADLHAVEWSENWHIPAGDAALARDLRERTLAQGAEIAAYGSYYRLGQNSDPAKDFLPTLQSAAALGAPLIRIWGGGTASAELDADTRRELAVEARIVSDMAASEGIKVALEWHKNTVTDTNESGLSFLDEAARRESLLPVAAHCSAEYGRAVCGAGYARSSRPSAQSACLLLAGRQAPPVCGRS